jgi:hypothetical protein
LLFNDKEVAPLPQTLDQWIPSAQRHGKAQASQQGFEPWSFLRFPNSLWSFPPGSPPQFPMPQNNIPVRHYRQGKLKASASAVMTRKKKSTNKSSKFNTPKNKKRRKEFNYKKCCTHFVRRPH